MKLIGILAIFWTLTHTEIQGDELKNLTQIIKSSVVAEKDLGIFVGQIEGSIVKPLFTYQADRLMIPASVTKIIPMAAALDTFGPAHTFSTELYLAGKREANIWNGDLILKGGGDPTFVSESLWVLVNDFYRQGITKIIGNILVDDRVFDPIRFDSSRLKVRVDKAYDAPVGGMSFNWNTVTIYVQPGAKVGDPAKVVVDPDAGYVQIDNRATTAKSETKSTLTVQKVKRSAGSEKYLISGKIPQFSAEKAYYKTIDQPDIWSGMNLKFFLKQRGIEVTGSVLAAEVPGGAQAIAKFESRPVSQIVSDMMKFSNNFVAEMLTKHIAKFHGDTGGSLELGVEHLRAYLTKAGIERKSYNLISPSGLSRENQFTAKDIGQLLHYIYNQFGYSSEAMASFPLSGTDGTLKKRLVDQPARLRGKTGLLNGVASLAGYLQSSGAPLIFVFLYNGSPQKTESAKHLFDLLAKSMLESR